MKLIITKSQNGGYIVKDHKSKALNVVAACADTTQEEEHKQKLELGKLVAGLVEEWYEKGQDKVVPMEEEPDNDDEPEEEDDGEMPSDFIAAIGKELLKFARKVPSRHKPRKKAGEESG